LDPSRAALTDLERAALEFTTSIAPLRIGRTCNAADLAAIFRLRGAEIIERGWASPDALLAGHDRDEYDDDAVQIAIWESDDVVGTCRLLLPSQQRLLPIERAFDLRLAPHGRVVQWSRLVLDHAHRGDPQHRLAIACFAALWLETNQRGFTACAGVIAKPMLDLYRAMGMSFEIVAAPRFVEGELRYPALSSAATIESALRVMRNLVV
jgi:N-acyl-L-homoserine lactone synthetase